MRMLWIVCLGLVLSFARAADAPADADAAWTALNKTFRPPLPPAEWATTRPTPEQQAEFSKSLATNSITVADQAKAFYEKYPDHPKAKEAQDREKSFRAQAARLQQAAEPPKPNTAVAAQKPEPPPANPAFQAKFEEAVKRFKERNQKEGPTGALDELDKSGRALSKEFPNEVEPWRMVFSAAQQFGPSPRSLEIYRFMMTNGPAELKEVARPEVARAELVGKPLSLAFKAVDGTEYDVKNLKGKVVLVDFWATWCGPCVASLPELQRLYAENHDKGLEVVGVSFDDDCEEMRRFTKKTDMPWPQFCDREKRETEMNKQFQIHSIPTMFLVDKKGILRDIYARQDLAKKVKDLLAE